MAASTRTRLAFFFISLLSNCPALIQSQQSREWRTVEEAESLMNHPENWANIGHGDSKVGADIDRLDQEAFRKQFLKEYFDKRPVILTGWRPEWYQALEQTTRRERLLDKFGQIKVQVGKGLEFNEVGRHTSEVPLSNYVENLPKDEYLFDYGRFHQNTGLANELTLPPGFEPLADRFRLPDKTIRFALGGHGQGMPFHRHMESYNIQIHGRKRWGVYAPGNMTPTGVLMSENYAYWLKHHRKGENFRPPDFEFVQGPGEFLYIPEDFAHATLSLGDSVAIVQHGAPKPGSAFFLQQVVLAKKGRDDEGSLRLLSKALQKDPTSSHIWYLKATLHEDVGEHDQVLKSLREGLKVNPLDSNTLSRVLTLLDDKKREAGKAKLIERIRKMGNLVIRDVNNFLRFRARRPSLLIQPTSHEL